MERVKEHSGICRPTSVEVELIIVQWRFLVFLQLCIISSFNIKLLDEFDCMSVSGS